MPTRNVNLTEELDRFIMTRVESGRYELIGLRLAIDEGDASGVAEGNVFARVRERLNRSAKP